LKQLSRGVALLTKAAIQGKSESAIDNARAQRLRQIIGMMQKALEAIQEVERQSPSAGSEPSNDSSWSAEEALREYTQFAEEPAPKDPCLVLAKAINGLAIKGDKMTAAIDGKRTGYASCEAFTGQVRALLKIDIDQSELVRCYEWLLAKVKAQDAAEKKEQLNVRVAVRYLLDLAQEVNEAERTQKEALRKSKLAAKKLMKDFKAAEASFRADLQRESEDEIRAAMEAAAAVKAEDERKAMAKKELREAQMAQKAGFNAKVQSKRQVSKESVATSSGSSTPATLTSGTTSPARSSPRAISPGSTSETLW